jgi:hypothetical protein
VYTEGRLSPYVTENAGLWIVEGIDPVQLKHYASYIEVATKCRPHVYSISVPAFVASAEAAASCPNRQMDSYLLGLLNVQVAVTSDIQHDPGWSRVGEIEGGLVYRNQNGMPRAFVAYDTQRLTDDDDPLARLGESAPGGPFMIVNGTDMSEANDPSSEAILEWTGSDRFAVEVNSKSPGFMVASVPYMPGWKVVNHNGVELPVYRAQMALMGTYVPAGKTNLQFRYSPDSYVLGKWVRGLAFIVSAIGFSFVSFQIWDRRRVNE